MNSKDEAQTAPNTAQASDLVSITSTPVEANALMEEVQTFLAKRAELAKKLAAEIEATEKKLADLKMTAASLFPANSTASPKDKKPLKVKAKRITREEEAAGDAPATEAA